MAIIDPDGLFGGDRLRRCGDMARLHWPYLFLAANGFGRIELDYGAIIRRAFYSFQVPPSRPSLWGYVEEFSKNDLIFLYRARTQVWGQFFCKAGSLPRWKTAKDRNSPVPPEPQYSQWESRYVSESTPLQKIPEDLGNIPSGIGVGVGFGVGVVEEFKNTSSPAAPAEGVSGDLFELSASLGTPVTRQSGNSRTAAGYSEPRESQKAGHEALQEKWFAEDFWPKYWRKVDKLDALKTFKNHAKTESIKNQIVDAVIAHAPMYLSRDPPHRPHAATWLKRKRYQEEPEEITATGHMNGIERDGVEHF